MIELILNSADSKFSKILLSIDNIPVSYVITDYKIVIDESIELGIHTLRLQLTDNESRIDIKDVKINGTSLKQALFFSFIEQNENRAQPATCIWDTSQIWVLPFMNPVSHWIGLLGEKLRKDALGTDLSLDYNIYIPESINMSNRFPRDIVDFFKFDFDCTILHKDDINIKSLPYEKYSGKLDLTGIYEEIYSKLDLIRSTVSKTQGQYVYSIQDDEMFDFDNSWFTTTICRADGGIKKYTVADSTVLPLTYNLVNSLNVDYYSITISVSPPGTYAYTHIDKKHTDADEKFKGCTQLYIPLNYPANAAIKFRNVGTLPQIPVVMNPQYYSHAVFNDSNETRIVLSVVFDHQIQHGRSH
jgi:hypothetical protein